MIQVKKGDILTQEVEALVNTVNCVGIMGRGIALQFKKAFPKNFVAYKEACDRGVVRPGRMFVYETGELTNPKYIINFPTKRHWRGKSRMEDIESGLIALRQEIEERSIRSVAIPPLGSGLGGLYWPDVRAKIEGVLAGLSNMEIIVFEPGEAPDPTIMARTKEAPTMTAGRATLVTLMDRYLKGLLDTSVTLLELHKLMYFMQEAGEPLRLNYRKAQYGPYAENLRHVLNQIEGHLVSGYADGGDNPRKELSLVPGAVDEATTMLKRHRNTANRFNRVSKLVEGFESPFGLELLATVHWLAAHEDVTTLDDMIHRTYAWNERKRRFSSRQIEITLNRLSKEGWI